MPFVPVMWTFWILLLASFVALKLYMSRLSRDEDDELILGDSLERVRIEQATITAKLNRIEPVEHIVVWVLGATSVLIAAYYVHDMIEQFK